MLISELSAFFLDEKAAKNQGCIQFLTLFERLAA